MSHVHTLRMRRFLYLLGAAVFLGALSLSCHELDDDRVPLYPVSVVFPTVAQWDVYGVAGAMDYRRFIIQERVPENFPYTAVSQTGYGGVLLVCDVAGQPKAFDLSCPVEARPDVRVHIDRENNIAVCDGCGSTYDVFSLDGHPISGPASRQGFGLRRYRVGPGRGGDYMVISN